MFICVSFCAAAKVVYFFKNRATFSVIFAALLEPGIKNQESRLFFLILGS
jgi:hypothetical protein